MIKRSISAVTAASILLSAAPAFAKSDDSRRGRDHAEDRMEHFEDDHSGTGAMMRMEHDKSGSGIMLHMNRGRSDEMKAEVTAEQKADMLERMQKRTTSVIKRAVSLLAKFAKRACGATEDTDSAVATCISNVKDSLKAEFQVMIDAAFGA